MVRSITFALLLAACGGKAAPHPTVALPPPTPDDASCDAATEDSPPGLHDRYTFQDADERYGYKDGRGQVVIPARFNFAYEFGVGGIAAVIVAPAAPDDHARLGFIDPAGAWLADAYMFDNGPDYFQEGVARIRGADGKVGFITRDGRTAIAPQFVDASSFCHGVAEVHDGRETWTIDRTGAAVGPRAPYVPSDDPCGE